MKVKQKFYKDLRGDIKAESSLANPHKARGILLALLCMLLAILACLPTQALAREGQVSVPEGKVQRVDWSRLSGQVRYDTMQDIVQEGFSASDTVIIASGSSFADALSVTSLAGYYKAPVLLTEKDKLSEQTKAEITRLGAKKAIVAGGSGVITDNVVSQTESLVGKGNVERLSGADRFATVNEIYNSGKKQNAWGKVAIVASGNNFADALSMSPYAYAKSTPIFLTNNGTLYNEFVQTIKEDGFDSVVIAGGTAAVSKETENALTAIGVNVTRLAGQTRYDTSIEVVDWCISNGLCYEGLGIAYGENFPDALAGGAFCGSTDSVLMIANENNYSKIIDILQKNASSIKRAYIFGGNAVISDNLYAKFQEATIEDKTDTKKVTGEDGTCVVVDKNGAEVKANVTYDKDGNGTYVALPGATITTNDDGSYSVDLPHDAKGKDVNVNLTDNKTEKPVATGTVVTATDAGTNVRGTGATDRQGNVAFAKDSGTTNSDGKTTVTDKDGNTTEVEVKIDTDGDGKGDTPVPGAKVTVDEDGNYDVELPEDAKGKDIVIDITDDKNNPVKDDTKVTVTDEDGNKRGEGETKDGTVIFDKETGVTGQDGKVTVTDKDGKTTEVEIQIDTDGDGKGDTAVPGAKVTVDEDGNYDVELPEDAKHQDVVIKVKDDDGDPIKDGTKVTVTDNDGAERGTGETKDGTVIFDKGTGVTGQDGKITVIGKYDNPVEATITYDSNNDGIPDSPIPGAKLSYDKDNDRYVVELPEGYEKSNVQVNLIDKKLNKPVDVNTKVIETDYKGNIQAIGSTDSNGNVLFNVATGVTDDKGKIDVITKDGEEVTATITYDHDNNPLTAELPLAGAKVTANINGGYSVELPELGKGKNVTVQLTGEDGKAVEVGTKVSAADYDGNDRGTGETDAKGKVVFDKTEAATGKDGTASVTDKDGNTTEVEVKIDTDGDGIGDTPVPGAKVTVDDEGNYDVELPDGATGKDIVINVKDDEGTPLHGKDVTTKDSDGNTRGTGTTDKDGNVVFDKGTGTTGEDGKTKVTDKDGNTTEVEVKIDTNGDGIGDTPVPGAKVTVDEDGNYDVELPDSAKGKDIVINVADEDGTPLPGKDVTTTDSNGSIRGTGTTDKDGNVVFDKNTGATDQDGKTTIIGKTGLPEVVTVTYDKDGDGVPETPVPGAKVTYDKENDRYVTELPEGMDDDTVKVNITTEDLKDPVKNATVVKTNPEGEVTGVGKTDTQGDVIFDKDSKIDGTTGTDGKTEVTNLDGEKITATITYDDDNDPSTPEVPLPGAKVIPTIDGGYDVELPDIAKGKDVKVNLKGEDGKAVDEGTKVTAKDADGNIRGTGTTDKQGDVIFDKGEATTGKDGTATVTDKDGKQTEVTVTYDDDNDPSTPEVPLPGAKVTIDEDGNYDVELPEDAKGKDVTVNVKDDKGNPVPEGTEVTTTDSDGNNRGTGKTDKDGNVIFDKSEGTTDKDGKTKVTDKDGNTSEVEVKIDTNGDGIGDTPIPGAKVTIDEDGNYDVKLPEGVEGKDIVVKVADEDGTPLPGKDVTTTESDGNNRGTGTTDEDGNVVFDKNTGTTGSEGKTNLIGKDGHTIESTVYYDPKGTGDYVPLPGAKVTYDEANDRYVVELPDGAEDKGVKVGLKDLTTDSAVADGTKVITTDTDGNIRGTGTTVSGLVIFSTSDGKTDKGGQTIIPNPNPNPDTDKGETAYVKATVTYSKDGTNYLTLADAKVMGTLDGNYSTVLSEPAFGNDVKVKLQYVDANGNNPKDFGAGVSVSATDYNGNNRGSELTDSTGTATFLKATGITDNTDGKTVVIGKDGKETEVTVTYDKDGDGIPETPLPGAKVTYDKDKEEYVIELPEEADGKDVKVKVLDNETGDPVETGTKVTTTDADGNNRGTGTTDDKGEVIFDKHTGSTGEDGKTSVIGKDGKPVVATVMYDSDNDGDPETPLSGAKVTYDADKDEYNIELPEDAKGKNVKVNLTGEEDSVPVAGTTVNATDADGTHRASGTTDDKGDVIFDKNSGTTDKDKGETVIPNPDPVPGHNPDEGKTETSTVKATVSYDRDNSGKYVALGDVVVTANADKTYSLALPAAAKGLSVKVELSYVDSTGTVTGPVAGVDVDATDADGNSRGIETTDTQGIAYFLNTKGETTKPTDPSVPTDPEVPTNPTNPDDGGTTDVVDKDGNLITVKITSSDDDETWYAVGEATVSVSEEGYSIVLPASAKGKSVKVALAYQKSGKALGKDISVTAQDADGNQRGTELTDKYGIATFLKAAGTTDPDKGETDIPNPDPNPDATQGETATIKAKVEGTLDNKNWYAVGDVKVAAKTAELYTLELPENVKGVSTRVTLSYVTEDGTVKGQVAGVAVQATDFDGNYRGTQTTDTYGIAIFWATKGTTTDPTDPTNPGDGGTTDVIDPQTSSLVRATVEYKATSDADYTPLGETKVTAVEGENGAKTSYDVILPAKAKGLSARVTLSNIDEDGNVEGPVADVIVRATDSDNNYRGEGTTDELGQVEFLSTTGTTTDPDKDGTGGEQGGDGEDGGDGGKGGTTEVVTPEGQAVRATVQYLKDNSTWTALGNAQVTANEDGTYSVLLPAAAKGYSVQVGLAWVNADGPDTAFGADVSVIATDADGNYRGVEQTNESGIATFMYNTGTTTDPDKEGEGGDKGNTGGGTTDVTDPETKKTIRATIECDYADGAGYKRLGDVKVTLENGKVSLELPEGAKGYTTRVTLNYLSDGVVGDAASGIEVVATDADGNYRGSETTDTQGQVVFLRSAGTTTDPTDPTDPDDGGTTDVVDQDEKTVTAHVSYLADDDDTYISLGDVKVSANATANDGETAYSLALPASAKGKTIKATLTYKETGKPVVGVEVSATDADGNLRTTQTTDKYGEVYFYNTDGTTKPDGTVDVIGEDETDTVVATVTYEPVYNAGFVPVSGASISYNKETSIYNLVVPNEVAGKTFVVNLAYKTSGTVIENATVAATHLDGTDRGSRTTDFEGNATFLRSEGTTGKDGTTTITDDTETEVIATVMSAPQGTGKDGSYTTKVSGASVKVTTGEDGQGNWTVDLPYNVASRDVRVALSYKEDGQPYVGALVEATINGSSRGEDTTDASGYVYFLVKDITSSTNLSTASLDIPADGYTFAYKAYTPSITLTDTQTGDTLEAGVDYTISYTNNYNATTNSAKATAKIVGKGKYFSGRSIKFDIAQAELSSATLDNTKTRIYNADNQYVGVSGDVDKNVKTKNGVWVKSKDYELQGNVESQANADGTNPSTNTLLDGKETYVAKVVPTSSNFKGELPYDWYIHQKNISGAAINLESTGNVYDVAYHTPKITSVELAYKGASGEDVAALSRGNEFMSLGDELGDNKISRKDVGFDNVVVTGKGNFCGTAQTAYTVTAKSIADDDVEIVSDAKDYTYDREQKTAEVKSATYNGENVSYTLDQTGTSGTDAGDYALKLTGNGNYKDTKTIPWKIKPATINSLTLVDGTLTYNGGEQTKRVNKVYAGNVEVYSTEYKIEGNIKENAGDYTATATATSGNFTGYATATWSIGKASISSAIQSGSLTYNGSSQSPTLSVSSSNGATAELDEDYTFSATSGQATSATNAGTYTGTVTGKGNFEGSTTCTWTIAPKSLTDDMVTVPSKTYTYNNGNAITPDVTVIDGSTPLTIDTDYTVGTASTVGTHNAVVTGINNYTGTVTKTNAWTINSSYPTDADTYWIAQAYIQTDIKQGRHNVDGVSSDPTTLEMKRSKAQIDEDMKVLHDKQDKTSDGMDKNALTTMYTTWMTDDSYHLYTQWNNKKGSNGESETAKVTDENAYVEFRIIQVGEHLNTEGDSTSGDDSVITFMACHSLPTAQKMNSSSSNSDGWGNSYMKNTVMKNYVAKGLSGLTSAAMYPYKKVTTGYYISSKSIWDGDVTTTKTDQFWLLSYSEIFGNSSSSFVGTYCKDEGTQYTWFKDKITNIKSNNKALKSMDFTRQASGAYSDKSLYAGFWLRSPDINVGSKFIYVGNAGYSDSFSAGTNIGVVPAFAM